MKSSKIRLDRWLSLAVFHPLRRAGFAGKSLRLPILMYHSLSDDPENGVMAYYKTNTAPAVFRRQMDFLAAAGYKTLDLAQTVKRMQSGQPFDERSVVITFDDGFRDFYQHGFPALDKHGFTATVFLPTNFIGETRRSFKNTECMTWPEVKELRKAGIGFGSHTVNHIELVKVPREQVERELRESRAEIEQQLGETVTTFAYPYGFPQENRSFARDFRDLLIQAGYDCCVTTMLGRVRPGDDPYCLKRLPANSLDDEAIFQAKLEGGYDWLTAPQKLAKGLKFWKYIFGRASRQPG
jgi:peptidoglycan/xylan/chitin deacetylase (PgdA/CDA1 family)